MIFSVTAMPIISFIRATGTDHPASMAHGIEWITEVYHMVFADTKLNISEDTATSIIINIDMTTGMIDEIIMATEVMEMTGTIATTEVIAIAKP